jgi:hypothetical protein
MTVLATSLSPGVIGSLGWALLHFVWQGAALAAALSIVTAFCRRASLRYALAVAALVLMVAAPAVTFLLLLPLSPPYTEWTRMASGAATAVFSNAVGALASGTVVCRCGLFHPACRRRILSG